MQTDRRGVLGGAIVGAALFAPGAQAAQMAQSGDMAKIAAAVGQGHNEAIARLREWIALPSIAAEKRDMDKGASLMVRLAKEAGFQQAVTVPTDGAPGVFATMDNGAARTLGLYFMYDVKQFDPAEWTSPPLEGRIVDKPGLGKALVGRGAINQKGPESAVLAALHAFKRSGVKLPVNLVLVAEGEEEIGSPHFKQIVQRPDVLAALKKCSGVIIPSMWQDPTSGDVAINLGAKGMIELELVASAENWDRGPTRDIHSSMKAIIDAPAWRLVAALQTLVTPDGNTPAIDGWFEKVRPLTAREKALIAESARARSSADELRQAGVKKWIGDTSWQETLERLAAMPTVNIEGLVGGYTGPGGKTILPAKMTAKIDMRLVPDQTAADCIAKLKAHLAKRGFADIAVNVSGGYDPTETDENSALIRAERATYTRAGIKTTLYPRLAGSWPGYIFTGAPVSLPAGQFGLGHGNGAHAPDEYLLIESSNPKVLGYDAATVGFADFLYQIAATG